MSSEYAEDIIPKLREFVERNSNIVDLQFNPKLPPKLLIDPWSKDYESKKRIAHYFLLVASIDEEGVIGGAENARYLMVELHKKYGEVLFEISEPERFEKEIIECKRYSEFGPLRGQISNILASVNTFVMDKTRGDLIECSQGYSQPKDMVEEIGRYIKRMGGRIKKKAWLYMRWMVRPRPDLRVFSHFSPRDLFIPMTANIVRVAACLGLVDKVEPIWWNHVEKVTQFARKVFPGDPVKVDYPFFLIGRWLRGKDLNIQVLKETLILFDVYPGETSASTVSNVEEMPKNKSITRSLFYPLFLKQTF